MHQTKKGNQWFFGMKAHIGVDSRTKVIHAVAATAANVHDAACLPTAPWRETKVWGDSAYQGQGAVIAACAPAAQDMTNRAIGATAWWMSGAGEEQDEVECPAKVEHPFLVIKRLFGFAKTRYRAWTRMRIACS